MFNLLRECLFKLRLIVLIWLSIIFLFCFSIVDVNAASDKSIKVGEPIKIGISGPMKFPAGEHMWIGAQIAAEEINSNGGMLIGGELREIKLFKADSNEYLSIPDAVSALERLIAVNKVDFIIGGARSEAILAQMEVMADNKVVYIMSGGGSPKLTMQIAKDYDKYKYFFRMTTPHVGNQIKSLSAALNVCGVKIRKDLGIQTPKVAIVMEKIAAVDAMIDVAEKTLPQIGMEIVGVWRPSPTANDVTAELTAVKNSGAHIIFTCTTGPVGIVLAKQWGELQIPALMIGVNVEGQVKRYWEATDGMCDYEIILNPVVRAKVTGRTISVYDKYVEKTGDYPLYTGIGAYDGIQVVLDAAQRAGTFESNALVAALENTDYLGVAGRIQFYPRNHQIPHDLKYGSKSSTIFVQQWRSGELVTVWPNGEAQNPGLGLGPGWEGVRFEGTVDPELPPVMINYWKGKK